MPSMSSPPSLFPPSQPAASLWRRYLRDWRRVLLGVFLAIAALLAPPSLGLGALIWWRTGKTWDYRERWAGTWVLAITGVVVYAALTWVAHPLPSLLPSLLHLCFTPTCALILEWLHPLTRRVRLLPRYRVLRRGKAGMAPTDGPVAGALSLVAAPHSSPSSSSSPSLQPPLPARSH
jgi:hypothetical protein